MDEIQLKNILTKHVAWLKNEASGERANLEGAHLERAHLEGANLERANLEGANLERANLEWAHLEWAHLEGARLDMSCWPLHCGSLKVGSCDDRLAEQLLFHLEMLPLSKKMRKEVNRIPLKIRRAFAERRDDLTAYRVKVKKNEPRT